MLKATRGESEGIGGLAEGGLKRGVTCGAGGEYRQGRWRCVGGFVIARRSNGF